MSSSESSHSSELSQSAAEEPRDWPATTRAALQRRLLAWFARHRRSFPWRANRDPYRIWVSEVMLQQTTAKAAIPYFERFMAAFPTLEALAAAEEQQVLQLWQGLGYYQRARNLHAAARQIMQQYGGQIPADVAIWRRLPGVGRYIAAAVLSQAFDQPLPIVEANSLRVLARLHGYRGDPRCGPGQRWIWEAAAKLIPAMQAGEYNQALMELGALICTPRQPRCQECPWRRWCRAYQQGQQEDIPPPASRRPMTPLSELAVLILDGPRLLLCQRPAVASRWPLLWEVPHAESSDFRSPETVRRIAVETTTMHVEPLELLAPLRYSVTRYRCIMYPWVARYCAGRFASQFYKAAEWLELDNLADYPLSSPQRRLLERWRDSRKQAQMRSLF
jgi:A/G-specific adenine glycosylase